MLRQRVEPDAPPPVPVRCFPHRAALVIAAVVFGCSIYANLSFAVTNPASYRFFPPFQPKVNANINRHLGGEYYSMARALAAGEGFAHPFDGPTGPTAWQPPVLPLILAGLHWACDGDRDAVMAIVIFLQAGILTGTGLLVLALAHRTTRLGTSWVTVVFLFGLLCHFSWSFQWTHDCWLVLLAVDLLIVGLCWWRPLDRWRSAAGWGFFGGICTLINPIVGFMCGLCSLLIGYRRRRWSQLTLAVLLMALTLTPWTLRNYLVFGRWVPVKSNLAYEAYQTQCLQTEGLLQGTTFHQHPYGRNRRERQEYEALGEMVYMDRKKEQFWQSVRANPEDYLLRIGSRFGGATLWYVPFYRESEARRPLVTWFCRVTHPLPFLALLFLICTSFWESLHRTQWITISIYLLYLLPYIVVSYYERYALPLLGVQALLLIWAVDRLLSFRRRGRTKNTAALLPSGGHSRWPPPGAGL